LSDTRLVPAGRESDTLTACASLGPLFTVLIVYVMSVFENAVAGPTFVMPRSAMVATVEVAVDELFVRFPSVIPVDEIVAVLLRVLPAPSAGSSLAMSV
jgi:hypothetical protein